MELKALQSRKACTAAEIATLALLVSIITAYVLPFLIYIYRCFFPRKTEADIFTPTFECSRNSCSQMWVGNFFSLLNLRYILNAILLVFLTDDEIAGLCVRFQRLLDGSYERHVFYMFSKANRRNMRTPGCVRDFC